MANPVKHLQQMGIFDPGSHVLPEAIGWYLMSHNGHVGYLNWRYLPYIYIYVELYIYICKSCVCGNIPLKSGLKYGTVAPV